MSHAAAPHAYEIKSASLPLVAFLLKTYDISVLRADLTRRLGGTPDFFDNDPVVIDLSSLDQPTASLDFAAICALLRSYRMVPVAVRGGHTHNMASAQRAGLFEARDLSSQKASPSRVETVVQEVIREVEVVREVPAEHLGAMVIDKPLRSGQHVYAKGRDLVVLAMVNPGAEIMADGHIHVYAPLRGKAIAGARGNESARIFTLSLEAELVAVAGIYRTSDTPLPPEVAGKPAQISLLGDKLVMQRL
ncbi:septum site-determining protein MinC [Limnohabitans sp.]|uniref:septum site-determining protein MinC n=1 Tax=Limnohabitans sp. TaxID=1907725 RepID=UPI0038BDC966